MEVHKSYEYQVTRYDPQTGNIGLFAQYINTFLKLKAETSGYQSWVQCPEVEDRYIGNFCNSEGVQLDKDATWSNPPMRGLAKLCLNSM